MKKKNRIFIYPLIIMGLVLMLTNSCKKKEEIPSLKTTAVTDITTTTATSGGNITADGGAAVTARGVCWSNGATPTTADSKTTDGTGTGSFTSAITGLTAGTTYNVRAYATNSAGTAYGTTKSFTTVPVEVPVLTTTTVTDITATTATSGGNITSDGGSAVTARGVCWGTYATPTIDDSKTTDGTGTGTFTSAITGLTAVTAYYVRAYATNSAGTGYGTAVLFSTIPPVGAPVLTTTAVTEITATTATSGGDITSDGGSAVTERGVCWSTSATPTIADSKTTDGTGTGTFTSALTDLAAGTTYNVRAYATNSVGIAYGDVVSFTTEAYELPVLTTSAISAITQTTATSGGDITSDGGTVVTARGVCWSTTENPEIDDNITTDGNGTGSFTSALSDLAAGTIYYVRAYATNSVGTSYGDQVSFTTSISANQIVDYDGNVYNKVTIGTQVWLVENLKVTHYRNGELITQATSAAEWIAQTAGAWYYYAADSIYFADYGILYNGYAVIDPRNIAPVGWHVPSLAEWTTLANFLGGEVACYPKLKEKGTAHWGTDDGATNESDFTALPGGYLDEGDGFMSYKGEAGFWWTTTNTDGIFEWIKIGPAVFAYRTGAAYLRGKNVRLIKD